MVGFAKQISGLSTRPVTAHPWVEGGANPSVLSTLGNSEGKVGIEVHGSP